MWENNINIYEIREIRSKTTAFLGAGAIEKINGILSSFKEQGIDRIMIVTGKNSYRTSGAWDVVESALNKLNIEYALYDKITSNPTADQIDEAAAIGRDMDAKAVIAIGGGSPIDGAKSAAVLLEYRDKDCRDLYEFRFTPVKAAPIVAVNLTHGTGSEVNRFAVATIPEKQYKPAIAYDCLYPLYSIDDPKLMTGLPKRQSIYVSVDAVNHAIEASTTRVRSPLTIMLAKEAVRLAAKYLQKVNTSPDDLRARYFLAYASMISGICFDNGMLHLTHALEHPLSAIKPELAHGFGLGILLPGVIKTIYPAVPDVLSYILSPMTGELKGIEEETEKVSDYVRQWLRSVGITHTLSGLGFSESDIDRSVNLAFDTPSLSLLLDMSPVKATRETISKIYMDAL